MMKKFLMTLMVLLFSASVFAAGVDVKGKFRVEGNYDNNINAMADEDEVVYKYTEQSFDLWTTFKANENTSVTALWNILGEEEAGRMWDTGPAESNDDASEDIQIDRLFLTHKFGTGVVVEAGLITWGSFGTLFGDNQEGWYGTSVAYEFGFGKVTGHYIKYAEAGGTLLIEDAEKDDSQGGFVTYENKMGDMNLAARAGYIYDSYEIQDQGHDSEDTWMLDVAVNGAIGNFGLEAEVIAENVSTDADYDEDSATLYAAYVDLSIKIADQTKVGGWLAYASVDEYYDADTEVGMGFGDDFDRSLIYLDENTPIGQELAGTTAIGLYADFAINDEMTVSPSGLYWMSNWDGDDSTGYELDVIFAWKLSGAVTWTARAGYADISLDWDGGGEPDTGAAIKASHEIAVTF